MNKHEFNLKVTVPFKKAYIAKDKITPAEIVARYADYCMTALAQYKERLLMHLFIFKDEIIMADKNFIIYGDNFCLNVSDFRIIDDLISQFSEDEVPVIEKESGRLLIKALSWRKDKKNINFDQLIDSILALMTK